MTREPMNVTSIGPVTKAQRNELKQLRDQLGHANYSQTIEYLLEVANEEV